ncbi:MULTISPECIES: NAD-glutamate dehydrogenase [Alteromonadaceae]|jgi:glutamate dehydrogenase|uniref:NAD-glutamate dehydrogenase n=1 Tax=Brumicola blandensis TaxID=3075611 RepID=A0AAW8R370_9ALTE|nr:MULTISPECIES: NAD-glutamate dehydrogenase [unclassified Alteromonas]MDT0581578.1 NAD-glutamate dehydrogenase [Alteromonas sp. W409]MDT0627153.1 NAD-glutamate dehydrogenase [Alteromonas sp. W364]
MSVTNHQHSVLLERVFSLINEKVENGDAPLIQQFGRLLYKNMSFEDIKGRSDSDLYGATLSLWQQMQNRKASEPCIKVFNPEIAKHGWQSSHTIIEIIVKDMPFLVDSVRMAINRFGISAHLLLHSPMYLTRGKDKKVSAFVDSQSKEKGVSAETVFLIEIDRQTKRSDIDKLKAELHSVVDEVSLSVADWQPMREKLASITKGFDKSNSNAIQAVKSQGKTFLNWLNDHNFTLMGYRHYQVKAIEGDHRWIPDNESSLGLMKNSINDRQRLISNLPASARDEALGDNPLILTKTNSRARVHRPAYMDYVGIKEFDSNGNVIGEHRFLGLYSASFYNSSATDLPMLKEKIDRMCAISGFDKGTHAYKAFVNIVETYPRDELLQTSDEELAQIVLGIFQMQERGISRLFVRKDVFGRFYSCLVYVPRERYNTQLRRETQALLKRSFKSDEAVEFNTYFSESVYARTHYIARVKNNNMEFDVNEIEDNLIELTKSWQDKLAAKITSAHGQAKGKALQKKYGNAFSRSYSEQNLPGAALVDIDRIELLNDDKKLDILFYRPQEESVESQNVKLKLYHRDVPIHLSDVLPMLENFGLRVIDESPYKVTNDDGEVSWVMDFSMLHKNGKDFNMEKAQELFQDAFSKVWNRTLEDDGFNRLILSAEITGRNVTILRAYAKYMRQIGTSFSIDYMANTLANYPDIATDVISLFRLMFCPKTKRMPKKIENLKEQVLSKLDKVSNLDDDRIIRRYLELLNATLRTNFYQSDEEGHEKSYISFKLLPSEISDMPLPMPKFEIFVYSPRVEGVHLRGGKVARGGLRWSDRQEDFRTEILGLVKAQQVKNTVIVPVGAKGGFVCKAMPENGGRAAIQAEGQACYKIFIRSLLDITDNIVNGEIVPPRDVIRLDEDDPYLVVAADKGTATFSDIANGISEEFNFWLGDAFASGGSVGYDHKKMGITARGAWESVKRHFREIGIDCQTTPFTAVGVGDMAGDVFGNGMLLSEQTRIICAFNHLHIFFDPSPDEKSSYAERQRLFEDPSLSWDDYDRKLISKGGGIFKRSEKAIPLSPEMKKWLGTRQATMTPNDLIHNALKMPVDLIWNGGIGTYVKSSKESHAEVGDRANDTTRVNGKDVKAKIVGEGGNLGLTQLGRIEYAANGGLVNTDFIDNVGGVDCSDNEVNIKILLNTLVNAGDLTVKQRNELLYAMTDDVSDIVIQDCYRQTQSISITNLAGVKQLKEQLRFIHGLERDGFLNRELEFIPSDDEISERVVTGQGLTRPELSVLIAYGKMVLKDQFNIPAITDNPYYDRLLVNAFPPVLREKYQAQMQEHPLRSEIIATKLTNEMVNDMGLNFVYRLQEETGASIEQVAEAYTVVKGVFGMGSLWEQVEDLDNKIDAQLQLEMLDAMRRILRRTSRWYIRHGGKTKDIESAIKRYQPAFKAVSDNLSDFLVESECKAVHDETQRLISLQVPKDIAYRVACLSNMFSSMDLAQIAELEKRPIEVVARLYYQLGSRFELHWFLDQINQQSVTNHWQALARASYREELDWQQRALTSVLLNIEPKAKDADKILNSWCEDNKEALERWYHMMTEFKTSDNHEFAKFSVALRELMLLSVKANH